MPPHPPATPRPPLPRWGARGEVVHELCLYTIELISSNSETHNNPDLNLSSPLDLRPTTISSNISLVRGIITFL